MKHMGDAGLEDVERSTLTDKFTKSGEEEN